MPIGPDPADALSPEAVGSVYAGALANDDDRRRVRAAYAVLCTARLGLRPGELLHCHDGWIDWRRGELHVPARDPCACEACWERARVRHRSGDGRAPATIVAEDLWCPPGDRGGRCLPFGWSGRLAAVIHAALGADGDPPPGTDWVRDDVAAAAKAAPGVDPAAVTVPALRASAIRFLAAVGFGPRRLADLFGIDEATAGAFAADGGGEASEHLYRTLDDGEGPPIGGPKSPYRLVCDPTTLAGEPFDPCEYDAAWRERRAERSRPRDRNPRSVAPPPDVAFDPEDRGVREPAGDAGPGLVPESLSEWVRRDASEEGTAPAGDGPASAERDADAADDAVANATAGTDENVDPDGHDDPGRSPQETAAEAVTAPIVFSLDTRFAAADLANGRPTGGTVLVGQAELVLWGRDGSTADTHRRIPLDRLEDLVLGYVPDPLETVFEDTVGIAYREAGERRVAVIELPGRNRRAFVAAVVGTVISDVAALVTHPSRIGGANSDETPVEARLFVADDVLRIESEGHESPVRVRLGDVLAVGTDARTHDGDYVTGLSVRHLQPAGPDLTTEIAAREDAYRTLLGRLLADGLERRKRRGRALSIDGDELRVIAALDATAADADLADLLQTTPASLSDRLASLAEQGLIRDDGTGPCLTGTGRLLLDDRPDRGTD